jgi:hypothetical protein
MKILLRALIVIAAVWAILAPASYGLLFGVFFDWSALVDFTIVGACGVLALNAYKDVSLMLWLTAFTIVTLSAVSGFFYHFRDSGESGPLPFEWMNVYFSQAMPLLAVSVLVRVLATDKQAEQVADDQLPARRESEIS